MVKGSPGVQHILGTFVLIPVEQLLNQLVAQDQHLCRKLQPFSDRILEVRSSSPAAVLLIRILDGKLRLGAVPAATLGRPADASISGRASDLFSLLLNSDKQALANRDIEITGDALFAQDLFNVFSDADIDWRDYLAPFLGDIATQEIGQLGKRASAWGKQASASLRRSVNDYVKEEIALVPDALEMERFNDQLDALKMALDRGEARAGLLQLRLDKSLKNQHLTS